MELDNLVGLFLLMILGLIISVFITAGEFMNEVRNIVVREQVRYRFYCCVGLGKVFSKACLKSCTVSVSKFHWYGIL